MEDLFVQSGLDSRRVGRQKEDDVIGARVSKSLPTDPFSFNKILDLPTRFIIAYH
jgi:hypothetical protein